MIKLLINGENAIMGRLSSYAAKQALEGNEIIILNAEKVIISGNKNNTIEKNKRLRALGGTAQKGPNYDRRPEMILKRAIRGMLPSHREGIGREAFKRIKCYSGVPKEFHDQKMIRIKSEKPKNYIELKELSEKI